jgi:hypothetical protein
VAETEHVSLSEMPLAASQGDCGEISRKPFVKRAITEKRIGSCQEQIRQKTGSQRFLREKVLFLKAINGQAAKQK